MADTKDQEVVVRGPYNRIEINTAEDAAMAYMRGQISEDEFKDAAATFGVLPGTLMLAPDRLERPDDAFENKLPDEIYKPTREHQPDLKERLKMADEKGKEREEASKKAEKSSEDVKQVEVVPLGTSETSSPKNVEAKTADKSTSEKTTAGKDK